MFPFKMVIFHSYLNLPEGSFHSSWDIKLSGSEGPELPSRREEMMVKLHKLQDEFAEMEVEGWLDHGKDD